MSDDERSGLENEAGGMNRGSLLKRLALGSAALSIPSLAAVEAAVAAPSAAPEPTTRPVTGRDQALDKKSHTIVQ